MYTKKEREQYNIYRDYVCKKLGLNKNQYNWLRRQSYKLSDLDCKWCNGEIEEDNYFRLIEEILTKIKGKFSNLYIYHQRDPRGLSLYISNNIELNRDNYYNEGLAIY